jgi:hypothetical protein
VTKCVTSVTRRDISRKIVISPRMYPPCILIIVMFLLIIQRVFMLNLLVPIHHYNSSLLFTVTIHHCFYSSSLLFIDDIYGTFLLSLFIDHPITPHFNYSSIMLSSKSKTSQTHIPVIRTPVTMIFLPVGTSHLVTHPRFLQVEHA